MPATPREYRIPGFRVCLVREPGVALAEKPLVQTPRDAVPIVAEYIGDRDREVFALALLTIRKRVIGPHTVCRPRERLDRAIRSELRRRSR